MRTHDGSAGARVLAFGGHQPARIVTNDELAASVETSDEWIRSRVGIASRRVAGPDETVADMAVAAAGKALAGSGLSPADIDLVIVATCTPEVMIPNTAAVVGPAGPTTEQPEPGIGPVAWGSDGDMADKIYIKDRNSYIVQEGQAIFRWATTALHPVAKRACADAGVDPGELAVFVPHQANLRIIEALARKIGAPQAKVASDIVTAGNTSSASIPLALSRMIERGELASGDKALLIGFGAGVCYAAQVITLP